MISKSGTNFFVKDLAKSEKKRETTWGLWIVQLMPIFASLILWGGSLIGDNPEKMTDFGLISILPVWFFLALLVLTVSFIFQLYKGKNQFIIYLLFAILIFILFGTPQILYGTLRYTWAWKHVGIVNYIQRLGTVDPTISTLSAYHNWPGFFTLSALFNVTAGLGSALTYAGWAPVFFNLIDVGALTLIFRSLTIDKRITWLAIWFFLLGNWIGQDYFSPQAMSFFLYLIIIGVILRWFRNMNPPSVLQIKRWLKNEKLSYLLNKIIGDSLLSGNPEKPAGKYQSIGLILIVTMIFTVIASSHQLTPFMVISALALLVVFQISKVLRLPILFSVITILWIIYMAVGFLAPNIYWIVKSIGTLVSNSQLVNTSVLSPVQAFIARVSQLFSISMVGLAILGFVRRVFNRSMDLPAILLIASPIPLLAANSYGGEMHLRVYYFALPFIAFLIAGLFFPRPNMGTAFRSQASVFLVSFLMLGSFMFTAYGREQMNYISPDEVNAITYLIKNAPKGSLFIGGTTNWPMLYQDYEYYQYMTILNLPPAEQKEFLANPAFEFANITKSYAHAYLILTKSQEAQIDLTHVLPPGSFSKIEDSLRSSPYFVVDFQNADAIIFSLKPGAIFPGESESSGLSE